MDRHLIVVSVDAMVWEDLEHLEELPNLKEFIEKGSLVQKMTTIYPSLTHPVHATLISGCTPGKTGITSRRGSRDRDGS
jgi:predicted AlkP superfamily pyrophosphatase or phosphodiesterase